MKVLTIRQPWATLIMQGVKRYEFRSWNTKFRGKFLIHAGKGIDKEAVVRLKKYLPNKPLPLGKILGKAELTDCIAMNDELARQLAAENNDIYTTHSFSRNYAFKLENIEKFDEPIEAKGQLGFWNYTEIK